MPDVFNLIDIEYGEDNEPTTDKPSNDETDTNTNTTDTTNGTGTENTETVSKETSFKEAVGNTENLSSLSLELLDMIEEPNVEIPAVPEV